MNIYYILQDLIWTGIYSIGSGSPWVWSTAHILLIGPVIPVRGRGYLWQPWRVPTFQRNALYSIVSWLFQGSFLFYLNLLAAIHAENQGLFGTYKMGHIPCGIEDGCFVQLPAITKQKSCGHSWASWKPVFFTERIPNKSFWDISDDSSSWHKRVSCAKKNPWNMDLYKQNELSLFHRENGGNGECFKYPLDSNDT